MSETTVNFELLNDAGAYVDADQIPILQDAGNVYGVKRTDTGAVVIPKGAGMVRDSAGVYHYTFTDPAPSLPYEYSVEVQYLGETNWVVGALAGGTMTSVYSNYDAFVLRWGLKNVIEASNKDGLKATEPNFTAVQQAFEFADDEINFSLAGGVVKVPLDFSLWAGRIPKNVQDYAHVLAYAYLYESRGWQEKQATKNKIKPIVQEVYTDLQMIRSGMKQLNAAPATDSNGDTISLEAAAIRRGRWTRYPDGVFFWV